MKEDKSIKVTCLKPKIGSGKIFEETPKHLPPDQDMFNLSDVIMVQVELTCIHVNFI